MLPLCFSVEEARCVIVGIRHGAFVQLRHCAFVEIRHLFLCGWDVALSYEYDILLLQSYDIPPPPTHSPPIACGTPDYVRSSLAVEALHIQPSHGLATGFSPVALRV